jgi:redox-sensitive bicupin YhaK (pirin superfamily)
MNHMRTIKQIVEGIKTSDGDGVQLTRIIGSAHLEMLDPFLMLDAFGSDEALDYIGGFPPHPHRGFETVTYMLAGKIRHEDSVGNTGLIETGGVQWMTAGKGIIHSEMPEQAAGLLAGLQLWVNLPAAEKMCAPKYQEKTAAEIPLENRAKGSLLKVIAGRTKNGTEGIINNALIHPIFWDVDLAESAIFTDYLPAEHNAFIYVIGGALTVADDPTPVSRGQLAVLTLGEGIQFQAKGNTRFILIAGQPLNETVERAGPFVMNNRAEIQQAFRDYQQGRFTA